jgi:hypothetical protein
MFHFSFLPFLPHANSCIFTQVKTKLANGSSCRICQSRHSTCALQLLSIVSLALSPWPGHVSMTENLMVAFRTVGFAVFDMRGGVRFRDVLFKLAKLPLSLVIRNYHAIGKYLLGIFQHHSTNILSSLIHKLQC